MMNPFVSKEFSLGFSLALVWQLLFLGALIAAFWIFDRKFLPHPLLVSIFGALIVTGSVALIDISWSLAAAGFSEFVLRVFGVGALAFVNSVLVSVHAFRSWATQPDFTARTDEYHEGAFRHSNSPLTVSFSMAMPIILNLLNLFSELQP